MYDVSSAPEAAGLPGFVRNRYFYGQLLDVHHFECEQLYFRNKLALINRLIHGFGVICGLDVVLSDDRGSVVVTPGVALDKAGRFIIVSKPSRSGKLPNPPVPEEEDSPEQEGDYAHDDDDREQHEHGKREHDKHEHGRHRHDCDDDHYVHVALCYHECEGDPEPVRVCDCEIVDPCAPSTIRERYCIELRPGKAREIEGESSLKDVFCGRRIDYRALACRITEGCPRLPHDPCIALANIRVPDDGCGYDPDDIDIGIRPIVYTNDLLFKLIIGLTDEGQKYPSGGKY
jgi:hypothetical protein